MPDHWSDLSKQNPKPLTKSRVTIAAALLAEVGQKASRGQFSNACPVIFLNQSPVILLCRSSTTKLPNRASLWQTHLASHGIRWDIRAYFLNPKPQATNVKSQPHVNLRSPKRTLRHTMARSVSSQRTQFQSRWLFLHSLLPASMT